MGKLSHQRGIEGEEIAVKYLQDKGFEVIERNFHSQQGEIVIIARDGQFLVFVEVKNYSFRSYGSPVGAVGRNKKKSIIRKSRRNNDLQSARRLPYRRSKKILSPG